jgi:hypothetical protein
MQYGAEVLFAIVETSWPLVPTNIVLPTLIAGQRFDVQLQQQAGEQRRTVFAGMRPVDFPLGSSVKVEYSISLVTDTSGIDIHRSATTTTFSRVWASEDKSLWGGIIPWEIPEDTKKVCAALRISRISYPAYTTAWFATLAAASMPTLTSSVVDVATECVSKQSTIKALEAKLKELEEKDGERRRQREEEIETLRLTRLRMEAELAVANARIKEDELAMNAMGAKVEILRKLVASRDDERSLSQSPSASPQESAGESASASAPCTTDTVATKQPEEPTTLEAPSSLAPGTAVKRRRVSGSESHEKAMDKLWNRAATRAAITTQNRSAIVALLAEAETECSLLREALREGDMCIICMVAPRDVVFMPCNHMNTCLACAKQITKCAVCSKYIRTRLTIVKS